MKSKNKSLQITEVRPEAATLKIGVAYRDKAEIEAIGWPTNIDLIALDDANRTIELLKDGQLKDQSYLPIRMIGLVSASREGEEQLKKIKELWRSEFQIEPPPALNITKSVEKSEILNWVIEQLVLLQEKTVRRNVSLMQSLVLVRTMHEETQEAFLRLERFAAVTFNLKREEVITLPPQGQTIRLGKNTEHNILQRLPVSSLGLSDLGLHISTKPRTLVGQLQVVLRALETGEIVGSWNLDAGKLESGWFRLSLETCLGVDEQGLQAEIEWDGSSELSLSLGSQHPEERFCVTYGGKSTDRPLAFKLWRGLPGTSPALPSNLTSLDRGRPKKWVIGEDILQQVESIAAPPNHVRYVDGEKMILVHPVSDSVPSVARLPKACPVGAKHVSAQIYAAKEAINHIEFSLALTQTEDMRSGPGKPQTKPGHRSEWLRLAPGEISQVHLFLPESLSVATDLFLATRLATGESNQNCNAYFKNLYASIQP